MSRKRSPLPKTGLPHPVIILGPALPGERTTIVQHEFVPTISTIDEAKAFARHPGSVSVNFQSRHRDGPNGCARGTRAHGLQKAVSALPDLRVHSVSTHMPVSNEDAGYTRDQLVRFRNVVQEVSRQKFHGDYKAHVLQSAGTLAFNDTPHEIVRAGVMLYGISPLPEFQKLLRPVMTWKTHIALIRDMPAGHGIRCGRTFITPPRNARGPGVSRLR